MLYCRPNKPGEVFGGVFIVTFVYSFPFSFLGVTLSGVAPAFLKKNMKIELRKPTQYEQRICKVFAEECAVSNSKEYSRRNQGNLEKVIQDIYYGKIAEVLVHDYLVSKRKNPSAPDFMIYDSRTKSFDADIKVHTKKIHVKSCMDGSSFPNSWLFQPNDPIIKNKSDDDILALVVLSNKPYMYFRTIKQSKLRKPLKTSLDKVVIYERDIP